MMARVARQVRATGHVQGVFFRAWTREQAERLDISGWIRNCPDGSIEAHLEGPDESVDKLLDLLRRGPSGARVDNLEVKESVPEYGDWFAVRH
jgi:acylphosphatase